MQIDIMRDSDGDISANHPRPILAAATDKRRRMFCRQDNIQGTPDSEGEAVLLLHGQKVHLLAGPPSSTFELRDRPSSALIRGDTCNLRHLLGLRIGGTREK